jgi:hypothetical protein
MLHPIAGFEIRTPLQLYQQLPLRFSTTTSLLQ